MPTYEYQCSKCGHVFDRYQSMADPPLKVCPKDSCKKRIWGKGRVKRVIGAGAGLIFKGSGFYITDYRSENYKEAAKKESKTTTSGSGDNKSGGASADSGKSAAKEKKSTAAKKSKE